MVRAIADYFGVSEGYLTGEKQMCFPVDENREYDIDLSNILSADGQLDISGVSPTAKIALIEFYNYLMDKTRNEMKPKDKKTEGNR